MILTPVERLNHWLAHKLSTEAFGVLSPQQRIMLIRNQNSINAKLAEKYKD